MNLRCPHCRAEHPSDPMLHRCTHCGTPLEVGYSADEFAKVGVFEGRGVWRYRRLLPVDRLVTLGEGDTGLHECQRLGRDLGVSRLYVKNEGENPTGSFKDRGMTVGIALAAATGVSVVACASTGNTSASMSAYAARAGLTAVVLIPAGKVAAGKLSQTRAHGAVIAEVDGNFDDAMRLVMELSLTDRSVYLLNSLNPFRLEGQKTLAFEVCETLGDAPEVVVLPMGNAGNISALWKGFREFKALGRITRLPRMIGVQAEHAAPIASAIARHEDLRPLADPETVATAIRIGSPVNWRKAILAIEESGGEAVTVGDGEILEAQLLLARREGLFVEPASAAPIAWLRKQRLKAEGAVVCVATGNGLKDPDAVREAPVRHERIAPSIDALRKLIAP